MLKVLQISLIITLTLILTSCGTSEDGTLSTINKNENSQSKPKENISNQVMYQNESSGIKIYEAQGWKKGQEKQSEHLNVVFNNEKVKAIVTSVVTKKSFEEIKSELKAGAGNVEVIDNEKDTLSFKSKLKDSVRTDIYIEKSGERTFIYTFMAPIKSYEESILDISVFLDNIEIK